MSCRADTQSKLAVFEDVDYEPPAREEIDWATDPADVNGLNVLPNTDAASLGDAYVRSHQVCYVLSGRLAVEDYIDEYGDREIEVPQYYSRMDQFDGYAGRVTASSGEVALGIDPCHLEAAIRAATGGGQYSTDAIDVIACGGEPFVVRTDDGDFLVAATPVGFAPDDFQTHTVAGLDVMEDSDTQREGIREFVRVIDEHTEHSIASHAKLSGGKHYFETADGDELSIGAHSLRDLARLTTDAGELTGEHEYEDPWGETFVATVTEDDYDYDVGEEAWGSTVIGYQLGWEDPRRNSRASLSGRVRLKAQHHRLVIRDSGNVTVRSRDETVYEKKPEEKDYAPFAE